MAKSSLFIVVPKNVPVPVGLIVFCKRYQIPLLRGPEVGPGQGWKIPGTEPGTAPCAAETPEPLTIPPEKCFHRVVAIDYENGVERCDSGGTGCGHIFREFTPVKHQCPEPDGICKDACMAQVVA